ncbi:MAG: Rab family GTPase [Candidatus Hodarchaeales archaeon]|jgi:small GTP-binding protein
MLNTINTNALADPNILKIALTGNGAVGKTSLCTKLTTGNIPGSYNLTIGCDIHTKAMEVVNEKPVSLVLWDLAGQSRFESIRPDFYRGTKAGLVVFDLTCRGSFYDVNTWIRELRRVEPEAPFIIVGNKSDKCKEDLREVSREEAENLAKKYGVPYIETSARDGMNVDKIFKEAAKLALTNPTSRDNRFLAY